MKAHAQIAHLVFANTQNANPKKPKSLSRIFIGKLFFCQRSTETKVI